MGQSVVTGTNARSGVKKVMVLMGDGRQTVCHLVQTHTFAFVTALHYGTACGTALWHCTVALHYGTLIWTRVDLLAALHQPHLSSR